MCEYSDLRHDRPLTGRPIFLPRGEPHAFRVTRASPGRNLIILTPGGIEEFFDAAILGSRT